MSHSNLVAGLHIGLKHYLEPDVLPRFENPLKFWKKNEQNWPQLHNLAMKYLCIQATSVPCERLLSKTGSIITEKRNRLKAKNVNSLSLLSSLPNTFLWILLFFSLAFLSLFHIWLFAFTLTLYFFLWSQNSQSNPLIFSVFDMCWPSHMNNYFYLIIRFDQ